MKRFCSIVACASVAVLAAACDNPLESRTSEAAEAAAPAFADTWYTVAATGASRLAALNIHETAGGLAGRAVLDDGAVLPVRNIVQNEQRLAFVVPGLDLAFAGVKSAEGGWSGEANEGVNATPLALTPGAAPDLGARHLVRLSDGRQMNLVCSGSGSPTVVFDSGAGSSSATWTAVQAEVAKSMRACAYDRAGLGLSDPGPLPRDVAAVASDLAAMLRAAGEAGPYVLVGHSLGSYHVRYFANVHPDQVAGMVLVDPSGDGQSARFAEAIPDFREKLMRNMDPQVSRTCVERMREGLVRRDDPLVETCGGNDPDAIEQRLAEVEAMDGASTEKLLATRRSYVDMPLIVLSRGDYEKEMPPELTQSDRKALENVWTGLHEEMAALSSVGERRVIAGSGHNIQRDAPQAVVDAVNEVVAVARR